MGLLPADFKSAASAIPPLAHGLILSLHLGLSRLHKGGPTPFCHSVAILA